MSGKSLKQTGRSDWKTFLKVGKGLMCEDFLKTRLSQPRINGSLFYIAPRVTWSKDLFTLQKSWMQSQNRYSDFKAQDI